MVTKKKFTPRDYQQKMVNHALTHKRCALFAGMGMGKTSATLELLSCLRLLDDSLRVLVIAPKRVALSTWQDELDKWEGFNGLKIAVAVGTAKKRLAALNSDANIVTINYENLEWLLANHDFDFNVIIADESTKLKSFRTRNGGKRAKALSKVAFKADRFVALTGTPAPNGLLDLWGQLWFVDKGERLGESYSAFTNFFFQKIPLGGMAHKFVPLEWAEKDIHTRIKDVCLSLEAKDYFELGDTIVTNIEVNLPSTARKQYKQLEDEMFTLLADGEEVEAVNAASLSVKCQQLASGAIYIDDDKNWTEIHDEKLDALESVEGESGGMPILVAYHFKHDKERILKRFPHAKELDSDPNTIKAWNRGDIPMLLAHPASAGHGLNLQDGGNILVFFSHTWNLEEHQQIVERIGATRQMQAGHDRPVFIYNIVAKDTIDSAIIGSRVKKQTAQQALMEAMKQWEGNHE